MTADDVHDAIVRHHAEMESTWIVLREAWAIDALAISATRGNAKPYYRWVSYEVKVSRSDFRTELRRWPGKAQRAIDFSHQYVFAVPKGLLRPEELKRRHPVARGLWVPALAGVLEVTKDSHARMAKRPQTRMVARDLTPYDIACLVRYAFRPWADTRARESLRAARWERQSAKAEVAAARHAQRHAIEALAKHAALRAQPGTRWRVPWLWAPYAPNREDERMVECEVVALEDYYGSAWVRLRRCDGGEEPRERARQTPDVEVGRFLLEAERVA